MTFALFLAGGLGLDRVGMLKDFSFSWISAMFSFLRRSHSVRGGSLLLPLPLAICFPKKGPVELVLYKDE